MFALSNFEGGFAVGFGCTPMTRMMATAMGVGMRPGMSASQRVLADSIVSGGDKHRPEHPAGPYPAARGGLWCLWGVWFLSTNPKAIDLTISLYRETTALEKNKALYTDYEDAIYHFADAVYEMSNGVHKVGRVEIYADSAKDDSGRGHLEGYLGSPGISCRLLARDSGRKNGQVGPRMDVRRSV